MSGKGVEKLQAEWDHQIAKEKESHWDDMSSTLSAAIALLEADEQAMGLESVRKALERLKPVLDAVNEESLVWSEKIWKQSIDTAN